MTRDRIGTEIHDGDKVVCISTLESFTNLKIAHIYTVSHAGVINALLLEGKQNQYMGYRFIKAESFTDAITLLNDYSGQKEAEISSLQRRIGKSLGKIADVLSWLEDEEIKPVRIKK